MTKYAVESKTLTDIANAIRGGVLEETNNFTPAQMPEKIQQAVNLNRESAYQMGWSEAYDPAFAEGKTAGVTEGIEQGKQDAYDAFWDAFQDYGNRNDNRYFCSYFNFTPETFKPKYPIKLSSYCFDNCQLNISLIEQGVEFAPPAYASTSLGYCFRNTKITELPSIDVSKGNTLSSAFSGSALLRRIEKIVTANETNYTNAFNNCSALEEIRFEGVIGKNIDFSDCPLSKESILSIITHLSDTSSAQTLTLKTSAVSAIDWTNTVIDDVTYNSFDEICDLKTNWTISLV